MNGQCIAVLLGHEEWIKSIALGGNHLISGGWDEAVLIWNIERPSLLKKIKLDMGPLSQIETGENKIITVCREEGFQHQLTIISFSCHDFLF